MKKVVLIILILGFAVAAIGCGQTSSTSTSPIYQNQIPFPSKDVVFQLNDLKAAYSSSSFKISEEYTRPQGLVRSTYAQAGIDLGYFDGFDPVLSTFKSQTLTTISTNEYTFVGTYDATAGGANISFKGFVEYLTSEAKYIVKVWGIRQGESSYRRWLYGDLINSKKGSIIIDPYIMWTSTHNYPMTIKFDYDATQTGTKVCTGGATGKWNVSSEVIGSTYFYCKEDDTDSSNTMVTFQMYQNITDETTGISILDKLFGKFNQDTKRLHGREWNSGYFDPDSGLLYVNTETFATVEGDVPTNINASSMTFPLTPEANFAAWPATSEFSSEPNF